MDGKMVYLDSSAIAKRYLAEDGVEAVDGLYHRAEARAVRLAFSLWNIGEVLGAVVKAERLGWVSARQARDARWAFLMETLKLRDLGVLRTVPVRGDLLAGALPLLLRHGIRQPDGLQLATCRDLGALAIISADHRLLEVARAEGLTAWDPVQDSARLRAL
jgi:uncharacterized protein